MDTSPSNDNLPLQIAALRREIEQINTRNGRTDQTLITILNVIKQSEQTFNVRVVSNLQSLFESFAHSLGHVVEEMRSSINNAYQGLKFEVVDLEHANQLTIVVTKVAEGSYTYANIATPTEFVTEGTEVFTEYFNDHPHVFGSTNVVLFNVMAPKLEEGPADGQN